MQQAHLLRDACSSHRVIERLQKNCSATLGFVTDHADTRGCKAVGSAGLCISVGQESRWNIDPCNMYRPCAVFGMSDTCWWQSLILNLVIHLPPSPIRSKLMTLRMNH